MISVAMCTYNGEKYIKNQIESLLKQDYKNTESFHLSLFLLPLPYTEKNKDCSTL